MQHLVSYAANYLITEIFHHSRCSLSLSFCTSRQALSLSSVYTSRQAFSPSLCTSRQERGCKWCPKERYDAALNRFRFPQLWNFMFSYIFPFQSYLLFINTVVPFSLCPTVPTLPIPNRYTIDIPCAIVELSGTMQNILSNFLCFCIFCHHLSVSLSKFKLQSLRHKGAAIWF